MQAFVPIPALSQLERDRFMAKVDLSGDCHLWMGSRDRHGRGRINLRRYPRLAPRVAYTMATGVDPQEMRVLHSCDNPSCVNPDHLVLGDQADNIADCVKKGRQARGERNGHNRRAGKLSEPVVRNIKQRLASGERPTDLAAEIGVGVNQISNIKYGRKWAWVQ